MVDYQHADVARRKKRNWAEFGQAYFILSEFEVN